MPILNKTNSIKKTKFQKGFTAIELGITLLVIGVLTVAVVKGVAPMLSGAKAHNLSNALMNLTTNVTRLSMTGDYGTANLNSVLITSEKIPSELKVVNPAGGTDSIEHVFGGFVNIEGRNRLYVISVTGLEKKDCIDLLLANSSGYERVFMGSAPNASAARLDAGSIGKLTPAIAESSCSAATGNSIHFVSR